MRILHVFDHSVPLQSGYAFRSLAILRHQRACGWETVHLTTPKHAVAAPPRETVDGLEFYRTPPLAGAFADMPAVGELRLIAAVEARLNEVAAETRPDILHAHSPVLNAIPALRVGRKRGLPVVYEIRAFWEDAAVDHGTARSGGLRYRVSRALETWAVRRADAVTTICEGLRGDLIGRGIAAEKITVIPNAVDPEQFPKVSRDPAFAARFGLADRFVLGFVGSFYAYEGLSLLVQAMPKLAARMPNAHLLLVGGGPEEAALKALVQSLGVADRVVFTGRVPHDDVGRYYGLIDVLVYPRLSIRLTELVTPLKPLEAMALGIMVVASDIGGHRELIRPDDTGQLFRAGDIDDLVATLVRRAEHRDTWPAQLQRARRFVESERTWANSVERYRPVYTRLGAAPVSVAVA